jgi:hypothetical protein
MTKRSTWLLLIGLTLLIFNPGKGETPALEKLFWQADFASVTAHFEKQDEKTLSLKDGLLWVECLARTGRSDLAGEKLQGLSAGIPPSSSILAAEGSVYLAQGRREQAERAVAFLEGFRRRGAMVRAAAGDDPGIPGILPGLPHRS